MGVNSLPKTVTRQHRSCDLNPGPSVPESSTLTTQLPSHPTRRQHILWSRRIVSLLLSDFFLCLFLVSWAHPHVTSMDRFCAGLHYITCAGLYIYTHPFNGPFSGTTQVSRYQKGKTNLDFTEARDSECQWHQLGHIQVCTWLQTDNHATLHNSVFYRPDALPAAQPIASIKALKAYTYTVAKINL